MKLVEIRTGQSSNIKTLFETLKDIITETNVIIDKTGLKILTMDSSHTVLVFLDLDESKFEYFLHVKIELLLVFLLFIFIN